MATQTVEIRAVDKTQQALGKINANLSKVEKRAKSVDNTFRSIAGLAAGVFAGLGLGRVASGVINVSRRFEDLRATLVTIEGNTAKAARSFKLIEDFTAGTPFQLDEVTEAFIKFKNAGLNPTTEFMTNVGNIAAGMGKRIDDVAQAVFNATTGEFEMLKQLGIKVKVEGDKLKVNFKGTTTTVANDGRSIIKLIDQIGKTEFAGGIERQSNTLTGALSNLKDATDKFSATIGESGLGLALTQLAKTFTSIVQSSNGLAQTIGEELGFMFFKLNEFIKESSFDMGKFIQGAKIAIAVLGGAGLVKVLQMVTNGVKSLTLAMARNPLGLLAVAAASLITYLSMENGLGRTIAQVSAVLKKLGAVAGSIATYFKNQLGRAIDFVTGIFDSFVEGIISGYNAIARFIPGLEEIEVTGKQVRDGLKDLAISGYEFVEEKIGDAKDAVMEWVDGNELAKSAIQEGQLLLNDLTTAWTNAGLTYDEAEKKARETYDALIATNKALGDQGDAADDAAGGLFGATEATNQLTKAQQDLVASFSKSFQQLTPKYLIDSLNDLETARREVEKQVNENTLLSETEKQQALSAILLQAENERLKIFEDFNKRQDKLFEASLEYRLNKYKAVNGQMLSEDEKANLQRIGQQEREEKYVKSRIDFEKKSTAEKYQFMADNASTFFSSLAAMDKKYARLAKAAAIVQAIINTYQGATKALASYPPPFNFIAAAATVAAGFAQVAAIRAQPAQRGGVIGQGQPALVGEDGPELIVPKQPSTVIPREVATAIEGMGGNNQPVTVNFNISTVDAEGFDDLLINRRGTIVGIINQAMNKRGRTGVTA